MDAGVVAFWIIGIVAGLIMVGGLLGLLGLLSWFVSFVYYFDHK